MKIAILHDYMNQYGGAERVLEILLELYPNADVYTLIYDKKSLSDKLKKIKVRKSFLNKFPFARLYYEYLLPFYPLAVEKIDTRNYDIIISNSSAWMKGAITNINTFHLTYCLNPMRFVWDSYFPFINRNGIKFKILNIILSILRIWDTHSSQRPDKYITISDFVQKRIKKYYKVYADVIYPPVNTDFFVPAPQKKQEEYFLLVSRLKAYKRIDIAVKAFNELSLPLVIIGEGTNKHYLQSIAKSNIQFLGNVDDKTLLSYYQRCKAFIFPSEEDFGLVPLEAQSCGKPVIAYKGGGSLETIIENQTGEFYYPQSYKALVQTVKDFNKNKYDSKLIREHALNFSKEKFKQEFKNAVEKYYNEYKQKPENV